MVALPSLSSPASQNCTIRATKSLRGCALPGHRPPRCYDGKISRTAPHLNHLPQTVMRKSSSSLDATRKQTTTETHGRINALAEGAQPYAGGRAESRRRHSGCFSATKHEENIFVCHVYDHKHAYRPRSVLAKRYIWKRAATRCRDAYTRMLLMSLALLKGGIVTDVLPGVVP